MTTKFTKLSDFKILFLRNASSNNMAIDGSSTPMIFKYTVPKGFGFLIQRMLIVITDLGVFNADGFGAGLALATGLELFILARNGDERDLYDGATIKQNGDWGLIAGVDVQMIASARGLGVRWTLAKTTGKPLLLESEYSIGMRVNDDLSNLIAFKTTVQGELNGAENFEL